MVKIRRHKSSRRSAQRGQTFVVVAVFLALFLLGVFGLATDYTQLWAHRQMAQAAADAACQAGAADIFLQYSNPSASSAYGIDFTWIGSTYTCADHPGSAPCQYAVKNGYTGANVSVSFPSSVPGAGSLGGFGTIAHPYIQVQITDPVQLSFAHLLTSSASVNTAAKATCGLQPVAVPIPLVVLHQSMSGALNRTGGSTFKVYGGPNRAIQVDSSSATAVTPTSGSSGSLDLSQAGPNGTGADIGVFGPEPQPGNPPVNLGTTGKWVSPGGPFGDPWVTVAEPTTTGMATGYVRPVGFGVNGCPDPGGCAEFTAGNYSGTCLTGSITYANTTNQPNACLILPISFAAWPDRNPGGNYSTAGVVIQPSKNNPGNYLFAVQTTGVASLTSNNTFPAGGWPTALNSTQTDGGVTWKNIGNFTRTGTNASQTAIFDPGVYYLGVQGLQLGSSSTARPSTATGDNSGGTTFFFSSNPGSGQNIGTINVGSSSGNAPACASTPSVNAGAGCIVSYQVDGGPYQTVTSRALQCPADTGPIVSPLTSSTKLNGSILLGPCTGTYGDTSGKFRGFLFFQKRSTTVTAQWGGGGNFLLSGFMYFHNSSTYGSVLNFNGSSGAQAFTLGNVVADQVNMTGGATFKMILNPALSFQVLRPTLLQ